MFYSHEVLTSRKYGVATVWLVATLGAKSHSKKVNRKAILEVDVPKACRTIIDPVAPMALRLQGNLLYGVSRVYVQQCGYVLSDAQNAYDLINLKLRTIKDAALDPQAGKAKPEQLVLQDDPSFLPEFAVPPPELLAELDLEPLHEQLRTTGESQSLTPLGSQQVPTTPEGTLGRLILPSSSVAAGETWMQGDDDPIAFGGHSGTLGAQDGNEVMFEPDFTFDADGNLVDLTEANVISGTPAIPGGGTMPSDGGGSARVRQEHEEGLRAGVESNNQMDLDLPIFEDNLPEGEAFPTAPPQQLDDASEIVKSSSTVVAAARKKRTARIIPADTTMELRNKDLADWNANYLKNMDEAKRVLRQKQLSKLSRKKAEYYVWGAGIGGIANRLSNVTGPTPFDMFIGDHLYEFYTGASREETARKKRGHDSGIDEATQQEARRVRQKTDEPDDQLRRGGQDESLFIPEDDEVEFPREQVSALEDQQMFSAMPWNISASIRGSSAVPRSGRFVMAGSAGAPSSLTARRGSRMISASPLHGRGQPGTLEALELFEEGEEDLGLAGAPPSSDMHEAATMQQDIRIRDALSAEGGNFLSFVAEAIDEKRDRVRAELEPMSDYLQRDAAGDIDEVNFEDILPPAENSRMVASQAMMMTLTLGTKGLLNVQQDEHFADISISLTKKAKLAQVEMRAGLDDNGNNEMWKAEEGDQLSEQFASGEDGSEMGEDDNDSLYAE